MSRRVARCFLFAYAALLLCPIRYWPLDHDPDSTWAFALSYAAAHGLAVGREVVFTTGPLGYLVFTHDVGNNLVRALCFQAAAWAVLIAIFFDLYFRGGFALRNLAFFSIYLGLASPLFWFNRLGLESQLLAGVLVLLTPACRRGGMTRFVTALVLTGIIPLIKLTGGAEACGALAGFLVYRIFERRWQAWPEVALAATVPVVVAGTICLCIAPSWEALAGFVKASRELSAGYSAAMSLEGPGLVVLAGVGVTILLAALFIIQASASRRAMASSALLLLAPIFLSMKHGLVRQDIHRILFFCMAALAMGLVSLLTPASGRRLVAMACTLALFMVLWPSLVARKQGFSKTARQASGGDSLSMVWHLLQGNLHARLGAESARNLPASDRVEAEVLSAIQGAPAASLSLRYNSAGLDGWNLRLYPVVQRYSAYTPYLDELNAVWIRDKGPRFLIFDGSTIDNRHPWAETPAMWLEVYRWYSTRMRGSRNLLLERRESPRFSRLESMRSFLVNLPGQLELPVSDQPVFWRIKFFLNARGRLREFLFRIPESTVTSSGVNVESSPYRIVPAVLTAPVMGNYLPGTLDEMAAVFEAHSAPRFAVRKLTFGGPGAGFYCSECECELLRAVE